MNGQAAEDLWHLTIDDLLAAPADAPRLGGPGPFVINLSTSTAPICVPAAGIAGYEHLRLYELSRTEDGRTRFRLRLGPISSELEADAILAAVRESYPSAFAANATEDDLKQLRREAPRAEPAAEVEAEAELEAEIDLSPVPPATAPAAPAAVEDSAEFAIDFDSLLPPIDSPVGPRAPATPAPASGAAADPTSTNRATPVSAGRAAPPSAGRATTKPTGAAAPASAVPATFPEPALDPNAVTDQVAVLTLPADGSPVELTLEDAAESVVIPTMEPAGEDDAVEELDLESIVAKNNAMVDALEARTGSPLAPELELRSEQIAAQMAEPLPFAEDARPVLLESLAQAESQAQKPIPPAAVLAAIAAAPTATPAGTSAPALAQTELHADIEADVDDFTSTIVGAEAEQEVEEVGDIVLEVAAIAPAPAPSAPPAAAARPKLAAEEPALALVPDASLVAEPEPEPVLLVDAVELTGLDRAGLHEELAAQTHVPLELVEADDAIPTLVAEVPAVEPPVLVDEVPVDPLALLEEVEVIAAEPVAAVVPVETVAEEAAAAAEPNDELPEYAPRGELPEAALHEELPASPPVPPRTLEILSDPMPAMDSTQTIRELTPLDLAAEEGSQYFAIQLALSDAPVDPDDVPHLDIFDAYRLYTVAGMHEGDFKHALRMGFFSDSTAAEAVAGYLRCYFETPAVKRVSHAERERFSQQRVVPKRDIGATGVHTVIELSTAPRVPERRLADISNNARHRTSDSGSLWSRLVSPLKR